MGKEGSDGDWEDGDGVPQVCLVSGRGRAAIEIMVGFSFMRWSMNSPKRSSR